MTQIVINAALQHICKARTKPTIAWHEVDKEFDRVSLGEYLRAPQSTPEELQRLEHREMLQDALQRQRFMGGLWVVLAAPYANPASPLFAGS